MTTLIDIALSSAGGLNAVRSLRILRAIRPLRALTKSSGMRLVLKSVALSIGAMVRVKGGLPLALYPLMPDPPMKAPPVET